MEKEILVIDNEFGCACCNKKSKNGEYRSIYIPWSKSKAIMGVCDLCKDHHFIPKKSKKSGNPLYVGGSNIPCTYGKTIIREGCRNG